jgi:hypothetical protein
MNNTTSTKLRMVLLGLCLVTATIGYSRAVSDTLVITNFEKFKQIPTCIGANCQAGQCSSPPKTDGPAADYLLHTDIKIGKIKHCSMLCETPKGICQNMIFTFSGEENVEQAGKQATTQFGKPIYSKEGSKFVYAWKYTTVNNQKLNIRLEVAADIQSGVMYVEEQI